MSGVQAVVIPRGGRSPSRHPSGPAPAQSYWALTLESNTLDPGVPWSAALVMWQEPTPQPGPPGLSGRPAGSLFVSLWDEVAQLPCGGGGWGAGPERAQSQPGGSPNTLSPTLRQGPRLPPPPRWRFWPGRPPGASGANISRWAPRAAHCGTVSGVQWECWALDSRSRETL